MIIKVTIIGHGRPFASFAALIAMYSKIPEFFMTAIVSIMPTRIQIVSTSTAFTQSSMVRIRVKTSNTAPVIAATVLWIFPEMIAETVPRKITIAIIC